MENNFYRNLGVHELLDTLCDLARELDLDTQDILFSDEYEEQRKQYKLCKNEVERRLRKLEDLDKAWEKLKEIYGD